MAVDGYGATTEEMERASTHVLSVNDAVQGDLSALRTQLAPVVGLWQGLAAVEFVRLMERWDLNARSLNEALRSIGESIQGSGRSYQQQEDTQAAGLSSIAAALG